MSQQGLRISRISWPRYYKWFIVCRMKNEEFDVWRIKMRTTKPQKRGENLYLDVSKPKHKNWWNTWNDILHAQSYCSFPADDMTSLIFTKSTHRRGIACIIISTKNNMYIIIQWHDIKYQILYINPCFRFELTFLSTLIFLFELSFSVIRGIQYFCSDDAKIIIFYSYAKMMVYKKM